MEGIGEGCWEWGVGGGLLGVGCRRDVGGGM